MDDHAPIPLIVPNWKYARLESAIGWDNLYADRIKEFLALFPKNSDHLSGEIINLNDA